LGLKKKGFAQIQKFPRKHIQQWNSKPFTNISNLDPRDTAHTEGGTEWMNPSAEACYMIEGWDLKHRWKRLCMQADREVHFAVSPTDTDELAH
jgi:hypothetical protein